MYIYAEMSQLLDVILDRCAPPITWSKPWPEKKISTPTRLKVKYQSFLNSRVHRYSSGARKTFLLKSFCLAAGGQI